jgi:hypothetical protein
LSFGFTGVFPDLGRALADLFFSVPVHRRAS